MECTHGCQDLGLLPSPPSCRLVRSTEILFPVHNHCQAFIPPEQALSQCVVSQSLIYIFLLFSIVLYRAMKCYCHNFFILRVNNKKGKKENCSREGV